MIASIKQDLEELQKKLHHPRNDEVRELAELFHRLLDYLLFKDSTHGGIFPRGIGNEETSKSSAPEVRGL